MKNFEAFPWPLPDGGELQISAAQFEKIPQDNGLEQISALLPEGMGRRIHTWDPRCNALREMANHLDLSGDCVALSSLMTRLFCRVRGMNLPVNVDGVLGAIVADISLAPDLAKVFFIFGQQAGLSSHYFEECANQPIMRRIDFSAAHYKGTEAREYPMDRLNPATYF